MLKTVTITDGRQIVLDDLDTITPEQGLDLATAIADVLVRSGQIRDDVALSGPHLMQFLSEMGDWLSAPQTNFVVNVTYDCAGPSETLGVFRSMEEAAGNIVDRIVKSANAKGVVVTDPQRETLATSVILGTGFSGHAKPTGRADEVALQPIREALGWVDYDISDLPTGTAEPVATDRIVLKGKADTYSSKRGLRYVEMSVSEPYDHEVRFTVVARPDQDDNDLTSALEPLWEGPVRVNARMTDDGLECTTDDIVRLRP